MITGTTRARRLAAAVALAAAALPGPFAGAAPTLPPLCTAISFSPAYGSDKTAVCVVHSGVMGSQERFEWEPRYAASMFVTTDAGRTWKERSALVSDLTATGGIDEFANVWVSPLYPKDKTIFVALVRSGLYASTDLGKTFTQVDAAATQDRLPLGAYRWGFDQLTPFVAGEDPTGELTGGIVGPRTYFAYAGGDRNAPALIDPVAKVHAYVAGAPTTEYHFAVPRNFGLTNPAIAITGLRTYGYETVPALFACTPALLCAVPLAQFPVTTRIDEFALGEDYATKRTVYASLMPSIFTPVDDETDPLTAVKSVDGGATFTPWLSVERLIEQTRRGGAVSASMRLATNPKYPKRMWLLLSYSSRRWGSGGPPELQLFRSDDTGNTWRRTAHLDLQADRIRGNLPGYVWTGIFADSDLIYTDNGRLALIAHNDHSDDMWYPTVFCTTDGKKFQRAGVCT